MSLLFCPFIFSIYLCLSVNFLRVFFVSALLRNCFLCWDCWNGTWRLHLMRPCYVALGQVLIWVECWIGFSNWEFAFKTFLSLNVKYTKLGWDSIHRVQRSFFYRMRKTDAFTLQATTAGLLKSYLSLFLSLSLSLLLSLSVTLFLSVSQCETDTMKNKLKYFKQRDLFFRKFFAQFFLREYFFLQFEWWPLKAPPANPRA